MLALEFCRQNGLLTTLVTNADGAVGILCISDA